MRALLLLLVPPVAVLRRLGPGVAAGWLVLGLVLVAGCGISSDVSRQLGARCDTKGQCDERCLTGAQYPGGLCSVSCDKDSDCPAGASCADLEGGVCLFACRKAQECTFLGTGWQCLSQPERGANPGDQVMVCIAPGN